MIATRIDFNIISSRLFATAMNRRPVRIKGTVKFLPEFPPLSTQVENGGGTL
jgi:hypothetical protein